MTCRLVPASSPPGKRYSIGLPPRMPEISGGGAVGSAAGHPFAARGGMKRCGSGRAGSIKRATTPTSGGHEKQRLRALPGPIPTHPAAAVSARISPSRRP